MELYGTVYECVEGIILTNSNVVTRIVLCTTLTNDDVASQTLLTAENLDAQSLCC